MKSRRVLQIIVAVLSIATLVCLALTAALLLVAEHIDVMPQQLVDFATTFKSGLKSIADKFYLYDSVVPAVALGAPALLLLIAVILLLTKSNGKEAKNVVGCIFALVGALVLTVFLMVFAKHLFDEALLIAAFGASGGLLALFIVFVGCALGVRPKRIRITDVGEETETTEDAEDASQLEPAEEKEEVPQAAEEEFEFEEDDEVEEESVTLEQINEQLAVLDKIFEQPKVTEEKHETVEQTEDTPATQYVPHLNVSIHDVVERTYGKDGNELSSTTLQKINKVRALYEANAITEQEYIKLINKYLGF